MPNVLDHLFDHVCVRFLELLSPPRCAACDGRLHRDAVFCASCVGSLSPPELLPLGVTASFGYGGALADAIRRFKYGQRPDLSRPLGRLVREGLPDRALVDLVVPVPLHPTRFRARGFDQAALLARAVATALQRPFSATLLTRVVDTPQLATLDAASRATAVRGAFTVRERTVPMGTRVLLVDDVRTTGATLRAAALAIVAAGFAARTHVLAATPVHGST